MNRPNIIDPRFKYVPSQSTDIRKTWARVRSEMAKQKPAKKETKK